MTVMADNRGDTPAAWLCMAVSGRRQHGGNDGYDDAPSSHYSWDSTVPNHAQIRCGDVIVLWDKEVLLGVSVIEEITVGSNDKSVYRCRFCNMSGIKARSSLSPRFKCYKCKGEFDDPLERVESVRTYRTRHDAAWIDLGGQLCGTDLRGLCVKPHSQLSLRPLRMGAFARALGENAVGAFRIVEAAQPLIRGGHGTALVRVRVGQAAFRRSLIENDGAICAFTGEAPIDVLDACHLYSYADVGEHHPHGGLLLRRDIHRLFDLGAIAVEPDAMTLDLVARLRSYQVYGQLHGRPLSVEVSAGVRLWLVKHWTLHRGHHPG